MSTGTHLSTHWFRVWTAGRWGGSGPGRWHEPLSLPPSGATHTASSRASPAPLPPGCTPRQTACRWATCRLRAGVESERKRRDAARVLSQHCASSILVWWRRMNPTAVYGLNVCSMNCVHTTLPVCFFFFKVRVQVKRLKPSQLVTVLNENGVVQRVKCCSSFTSSECSFLPNGPKK